MPKGQKRHALGNSRKQAILNLLESGPMTRKQIADALNGASSSVAAHLAALNEAGKVYICNHIPNHMGMPAAVWGLGNKPNVEYVPKCLPATKTSAEERRQQILKLLKEKPRSAQQLVGSIHVVKKTISVYIAQLRRPDSRKLYIIRWLAPGVAYPGARAASWVPVYAVGDKPDAQKPKRETKAERYARQKQSEKFLEAERRRARIYYVVKKTRKKPNGIFGALGI